MVRKRVFRLDEKLTLFETKRFAPTKYVVGLGPVKGAIRNVRKDCLSTFTALVYELFRKTKTYQFIDGALPRPIQRSQGTSKRPQRTPKQGTPRDPKEPLRDSKGLPRDS